MFCKHFKSCSVAPNVSVILQRPKFSRLSRIYSSLMMTVNHEHVRNDVAKLNVVIANTYEIFIPINQCYRMYGEAKAPNGENVIYNSSFFYQLVA